MDQSTQSNKIQKIAISLLVAIIVLGIGYYLGASLGKNKTGESREAILKEVFSNFSFVNNLSGKILEISPDKKSLIVEVSGVYGANLLREYQKKKIFIGENIKITLRETKDLTVFEKELNELKKKGEIIPPFPYVEKEIKVDDLLVGDAISFNFHQDENINILSAQFIAVQINVNR